MDTLEFLWNKTQQIANPRHTSVVIGKRHVVATNYGNIGICATLGVDCTSTDINSLDLRHIPNRIVANAAINACLNHKAQITGVGDIFDAVNFKHYHNICMIGYFGSLAQKFSNCGINLNIFDLDRNDVPTLPMQQQAIYLRQSDCIIATATTISNGTFNGIIEQTPPNAHVFLLGPSTPLTPIMFQIQQVKGLFGIIFSTNDTKTPAAVSNNTPYGEFKHNGQKVYMLNNL